MFFELAGRHRKLGVPWPLCSAEGRPNGSCQQAATLRPYPSRAPWSHSGSDPLLPETRSAEKSAGQDTRALGVQGEGAGGRPTQGLGASNLDQDALLFLGECRSDELRVSGGQQKPGG